MKHCSSFFLYFSIHITHTLHLHYLKNLWALCFEWCSYKLKRVSVTALHESLVVCVYHCEWIWLCLGYHVSEPAVYLWYTLFWIRANRIQRRKFCFLSLDLKYKISDLVIILNYQWIVLCNVTLRIHMT